MISGTVGTTDDSKLSIAAEELIKAARSHAESTSHALGKETVEGLKKIEQSIQSLKEDLKAELSDLKEEMVKAIAIQNKNQFLEWEISNAGSNPFQYFGKNVYKAESTPLVTMILLCFRRGNGFELNYEYYLSPIHCKNEERQKEFREALIEQIHELTCQEPRIELKEQGFMIYYS